MTKKLFPRCMAAAAACVITAGATGCAQVVPLESAEDANNPLCAAVTVRLPDTVSEFHKRQTNAQATGAWGDPTTVILRCGLKPSGPSTLPCVSVDGVDWLVDDAEAPRYRFIAYGRNPGLEVYVDSEKLSGTDALLELSHAARQLPQERQCSAVTNSIPGTATE